MNYRISLFFCSFVLSGTIQAQAPEKCSVTDRDGDGVDAVECGGRDCDDANPNRYPGNTEICDEHDVDEDCDPETFGNKDSDRDGYVDQKCGNVAFQSREKVYRLTESRSSRAVLWVKEKQAKTKPDDSIASEIDT